MKYKTVSGEERIVKLPSYVVTDIIPAPDLVGRSRDMFNNLVREASSVFGVKDIGSYVRRTLNRGECIITRDDQVATIVCSRMVVTVNLTSCEITNVLHSD